MVYRTLLTFAGKKKKERKVRDDGEGWKNHPEYLKRPSPGKRGKMSH